MKNKWTYELTYLIYNTKTRDKRFFNGLKKEMLANIEEFGNKEHSDEYILIENDLCNFDY